MHGTTNLKPKISGMPEKLETFCNKMGALILELHAVKFITFFDEFSIFIANTRIKPVLCLS
jgi:hypothetical protein